MLICFIPVAPQLGTFTIEQSQDDNNRTPRRVGRGANLGAQRHAGFLDEALATTGDTEC
jgi:hypothetical protein